MHPRFRYTPRAGRLFIVELRRCKSTYERDTMFVLLSPSKKMNFSHDLPEHVTARLSEPEFLSQTSALVETMESKSAKQIKELMKLSDNLAALNHERYQSFAQNPTMAAWFAFEGDTYKDIPKALYDAQDFEWAQSRVRILSGLYGALRPLDTIRPYRLEMGTRLVHNDSTNLYQVWKSTLTKALNEAIAQSGSSYVINLASKEYFSAVDFDALNVPVVSPSFKDEKAGVYKVMSFYAKRARGQMADFIVRNRVETLDDLATFHGAGYTFMPEESGESEPVFKRSEVARMQAK